MSRDLTIQDLPPDHARFVVEFITLGGRPEDGADAVVRAGLARDHKDAELTARILLASPKISKAIKNEVEHRFHVYAGAAARTVYDLSQNARSEQVRLSASQEILNRSIGAIPSRNAHAHLHANAKSIEDLIKALDESEAEAVRGPAIDATFTEVHDDSPPPPRAAPATDTISERMARDAERYAAQEQDAADDTETG